MSIIRNLAAEPLACVILTVLFFLFATLLNILILHSLLQMHRSKTAMKKLMKEYTFFQKLRLLPYEAHCLHAPLFCKFLIRLQWLGGGCFALYLLIWLFNMVGLLSDPFLGWSTLVFFLLYDLPAFIINGVLSRPVIGRFREYSFRKYHNTADHRSLL